MPSVKRRYEIAAPADKVWAIAGGFFEWHKWHPAVKATALTLGGRGRRLELGNGARVDEWLVAYDMQKMSLTYSIAKSNLPFAAYRATVKITAKGPNESVIDWQGIFTPKGIADKQAKELVAGLYDSGYAAIKKKLEA